MGAGMKRSSGASVSIGASKSRDMRSEEHPTARAIKAVDAALIAKYSGKF